MSDDNSRIPLLSSARRLVFPWHHGEAFTLLRLSVMELVGARFSGQDLDGTKRISGETFSPDIATVENQTRKVT